MTLRSLLERCASGDLAVEDAVRELRYLPYDDLGYARVDHHRELRLGVPESVYGPGKTAEQVAAIVASLLERSTGAVLVTRASKEQYAAVAAISPGAVLHEPAGVIVARSARLVAGPPVAVASAGTADLAVAEEAAVTAQALGLSVERVFDVGVAGLHRLLNARPVLERCAVVIVVAGMEGALASVVGGLVATPVVAVPTSVGYGAGAGGIAPLLTMLNSCAPGVVVVNIDNGYGAAVFAAMLLNSRNRQPEAAPGSVPGTPAAPQAVPQAATQAAAGAIPGDAQ